MLRNAYSGLTAPFVGIKLILTRKSLLPVSIIPIIINAVLYVALGIVVYAYYGDIVGLVVSNPETWLGKALYWVFWVFFLLFVLAFFVFSFTVIGSILLSPFNGVIARRTYKLLAGKEVAASDERGFISAGYASLKLELKKLIVVFIPVFFLYILGIFFPLFAVIALIIGSLAVTFEYMDYIMEEKGLRLRDRMRILLGNPAGCFVFGFIASIMVSVPVIGIICIPSSVAGATSLFLKMEK